MEAPTRAGLSVESCVHRVRHVHGTYSAYVKCCCRCGDCRVAKREYTREQRFQAASVRWGSARPSSLWVDNSEAAENVASLLPAGVSARRLAASAKVSKDTVRLVRSGLSRQTPAVVERLGEVRFADVGTRLGVVRRIQILMAVGWPLKRIAAEAGQPYRELRYVLTGVTERVSQRVWQRIAAVFERLRRVDPVDAGVTPARVAATRARAVDEHWPSEWAFDELELVRDGKKLVVLDVDDPASMPDGIVGGVAPPVVCKPWKDMSPDERVDWFAAAAASGIGFAEAIRLSGAPSADAVKTSARRRGVNGVRGWFAAADKTQWRLMTPQERVWFFAEAAVSGLSWVEALRTSGAPSEAAALRAMERAEVTGVKNWFQQPWNAFVFLNQEEPPARGSSSSNNIGHHAPQEEKGVSWLM